MGIEAATFVSDLQAANPGASDLRSQGDDHLRLLKAVLQTTFPTASKAFYNPTTAAKSANFTVVAADMHKTFIVDTSGGAVNMTLPTLGAGDAGWECYHIKTTQGVNPVFVVPASGTLTSGSIAGMAKARRSVPGSKIRSFWTGTAWFISRAEGLGGPVGVMLDFSGTSLPFGFEWPSGQTLASAASNYPEFVTLYGSGVTLDMRGRVPVPLDNLGGSAASRWAAATSVGVAGGVASVGLTAGNIPTITSNGNNGITVYPGGNPALNVPYTASGWGDDPVTGLGSTGGFKIPYNTTGVGNVASHSATNSISVTSNNTSGGGTGSAFATLPPYAAVSYILVVE